VLGVRLRIQWLILAAGFALLFVLVRQIGAETIAGLLASLGGNFLVIVAIFSCHECVRAVALGLCIGPEHRPPYRQLLRIRFLGELAGALTRTGPFAGEPTRAILVARRAERAAHGVGKAASELILNSFFSALVSIAVALAALTEHRFHGAVHALATVILWASVGYCSIVLAVVASGTELIGKIVQGLKRVPWLGSRVRVEAGHVVQMEQAILQTLTAPASTLISIGLLELLAQFILIFEVFWTLRSMGVTMSFESALFVEILIKAPNIVQFVGVTEGGYALVTEWLGMTAAAGLALSLVRLLRSVTASLACLGILGALERLRTVDRQVPNGSSL
jgi:hypothetical protein